MDTRIPLFAEIGCALFGIAGGMALAAYLGLAPAVTRELETTRTQLHAVQDQLITSEHERQTLSTQVATRTSESQHQSDRTQDRVVDRVFDPTTGHLVHEHIENHRQTTITTHQATSEFHAERQAVLEKDHALAQAHTATDLSQEVHTEVDHANAETGFSVGVLATAGGVGPAVGWQVVAVGPLKVRAIAGVLAHGPDPRVGLVIGGQVLPAIDLGVGAVLAPAGHEPLAYPLGLAEVAPAVSLQYRF